MAADLNSERPTSRYLAISKRVGWDWGFEYGEFVQHYTTKKW
jgi:hypothetical protein